MLSKMKTSTLSCLNLNSTNQPKLLTKQNCMRCEVCEKLLDCTFIYNFFCLSISSNVNVNVNLCSTKTNWELISMTFWSHRIKLTHEWSISDLALGKMRQHINLGESNTILFKNKSIFQIITPNVYFHFNESEIFYG